MNDGRRLIIEPTSGITPEQARDARARAWVFVFQCWQEMQKAARPGGPDDANEPDVRALLDRYAWLSDKVLADGWNHATVLPQLHVLVYGNKRGV